jgi:ribosomal-protein-alanine N-acetyltransferase
VVQMVGVFKGYLQTLCVAHSWRGQGLGTLLVQHCEQRIFWESPNVFICVSSFNPDAERLYLRLGYERVGVLKDFVIPGHGEILLRKSIGSWSEFRPT